MKASLFWSLLCHGHTSMLRTHKAKDLLILREAIPPSFMATSDFRSEQFGKSVGKQAIITNSGNGRGGKERNSLLSRHRCHCLGLVSAPFRLFCTPNDPRLFSSSLK